MSHRWLALGAALAACGDDRTDPNSCQPDGTAQLDQGELLGAPIGPFARAHVVSSAGPTAIVLDEASGACGVTASSGKHIVLLWCEPPTPGTYVVVSERLFDCPGANVLGLIEQSDGVDLGSAISGTISIDSAAGCVRGTFELSFGENPVTGELDARVCE